MADVIWVRTNLLLYGRFCFPPVPVGRVGCGVPETGHPALHLEADMTACDPLETRELRHKVRR